MDFKQYLKKQLKIKLRKRRYKHTKGVVKVAKELGKYYNVDTDKLTIAGFLHDIGKPFEKDVMLILAQKNRVMLDEFERESKGLMHAKISRLIAEKDYGIKDEEILLSIENHTYGRIGMNIYEKIILIADMIEPYREFYERVKYISDFAYQDLDVAVYHTLKECLKFVLEEEKNLHPNSVKVYNHYHKTYISKKNVMDL